MVLFRFLTCPLRNAGSGSRKSRGDAGPMEQICSLKDGVPVEFIRIRLGKG